MIFYSLIATCVLQWLLYRRRPLESPIWIIFLIYLYYAYFVPVAMVLTGQYQLELLEQPFWVNDPDIVLTAASSFLGYAGLAIGYWFVTRKDDWTDALRPRPVLALFQSFAAPRVIAFTIATLLTILITFFNEQILLLLSGYSEKIAVNYENGAFSFVVGNIIIAASVILNYLILNSTRRWITSAFALATFIAISFLLYTKQPFIFAAIACVCTLSRWRRNSAFLLMIGIAATAVLTLVYVVPIFAVYRAEGEFTIYAYQQVSLTSIFSDAIGPFGVMIYAFNGFVRVIGHPLWQSAVLWIPRFIWSDRPLDLGEDFAREVITNWQPGFGVAFSPVAEGYARLGLIGAALLMAVIGIGIGAFEKMAARFAPKDARRAMALTVTGYLALSVLRNPFSALFTQGLQISLPVTLMALIATYLQRRESLGQARAPSFNAIA